jgi:hypothetical protein
MSIITRQERERLVLDFYNQDELKHEIAKEARMSFKDIVSILNKTFEEKKTEGSKEERIKQQDNKDAANKNQKQQQLSLSTQTYKLSFLEVRLH